MRSPRAGAGGEITSGPFSVSSQVEEDSDGWDRATPISNWDVGADDELDLRGRS